MARTLRHRVYKGFFDDVIEPIYCFHEYDELEDRTFCGEIEYKEIMELVGSDVKLRYFYESKGREIDRAIEKFRECKKSTERDVFICVKISAATEKDPTAKRRTKDYEYALRVYNDLEKLGVNAFYSFVTLENVKWYEKAYANGHEPAKEGAERCRANISGSKRKKR